MVEPHPAKRRRLSPSPTPSTGNNGTLASLTRSITPPSSSRTPGVLHSPIQLTHIRDLAPSSGNNVDTVRLTDILGDPMIRECWQFNYCFDVDFLMRQFDEDVRSLVKVKVVHGSWKRDSPNKVMIDEACERFPNVEAIVAYMPEAFGTHHSKMMILLRHDDQAQVVIHTANMIPGDWTNMTQAVWRSPLLPLQKKTPSNEQEAGASALGTGARFKRDLLNYLKFYGPKKTGPLVSQLSQYDFSSVRAALVASVPSKQKLLDSQDSQRKTLWGWLALKDVLRHVPGLQKDKKSKSPRIVIQISSIASLGQTDKWLKEVLFESLCPQDSSAPQPPPKHSIIFPTPDEVRRSLNGYASGGSIHMKLQSAAQQKQLQYMRPYLCRWAGHEAANETKTKTNNTSTTKEAGRRRAAPHIKTYIRFSDAEAMDSIDWATITSANLSTQAWGAAVNQAGEVRICSYEIGVVVWPDLFATTDTSSPHATMVPCFKRDLPDVGDRQKGAAAGSTIVGLRMPYDIPLSPYTADDVPWCATANHTEPDWLGQSWLVDE